MKPTKFPQANGTLSGYGEVGDLPVFRGDMQIISCWRLSWRDRFRALLFGTVWLHVLSGSTHHPVGLQTEDPFR